MKYYYKCACSSQLGVQLQRFFDAAIEAALAADDYAQHYGAVSYIQPSQYFEGGVDFLEFAPGHEPSKQVWRKRTDLGDSPVWEPNCTVTAGVLVMNDTRSMPSSTWRRTYERRHLTWPQVRYNYPLNYWLELINAHPSGDVPTDQQKVAEVLSGKFFVPFFDYLPFGSHNVPKSLEKFAHKAVQAEQRRHRLPVVHTEQLLSLLLPAPSDGEKPSRNSDTPTLFIYKGHFYIGIDMPCTADGLSEISHQQHEVAKKAATQQQSQGGK